MTWCRCHCKRIKVRLDLIKYNSLWNIYLTRKESPIKKVSSSISVNSCTLSAWYENQVSRQVSHFHFLQTIHYIDIFYLVKHLPVWEDTHPIVLKPFVIPYFHVDSFPFPSIFPLCFCVSPSFFFPYSSLMILLFPHYTCIWLLQGLLLLFLLFSSMD